MEVGDSSSPFSPESNFRELDDFYLQTQARIWIGEVLQTRFDENENMSELLADGELLFEVSGVVWRMLLTRYKELKNIEAFKYEPFASRKSSRSYMPYSNVDSFLKFTHNQYFDIQEFSNLTLHSLGSIYIGLFD